LAWFGMSRAAPSMRPADARDANRRKRETIMIIIQE
jgi:hypothetical protein